MPTTFGLASDQVRVGVLARKLSRGSPYGGRRAALTPPLNIVAGSASSQVALPLVGTHQNLCAVQWRQSKSRLTILNDQRGGHRYGIYQCPGCKWACVPLFDHLGNDPIIPLSWHARQNLGHSVYQGLNATEPGPMNRSIKTPSIRHALRLSASYGRFCLTACHSFPSLPRLL